MLPTNEEEDTNPITLRTHPMTLRSHTRRRNRLDTSFEANVQCICKKNSENKQAIYSYVSGLALAMKWYFYKHEVLVGGFLKANHFTLPVMLHGIVMDFLMIYHYHDDNAYFDMALLKEQYQKVCMDLYRPKKSKKKTN